MAEWLTPERLMPWWPSPVTRKNVSEANFPVSGLPLSERSLWPTIQPINRSTDLSRLLLRLLFRRAATVPGTAAFLATTGRGEPAANQPSSGDAYDSPDDDGFEVHERRMTT